MGACQSLHLKSVVPKAASLACSTDFTFTDDIPPELLSLIARSLLSSNLPALLCLSTANKALYGELAELRETAAACRLRWVKERMKCHVISNEDRTVTLSIGGNPWVCGTCKADASAATRKEMPVQPGRCQCQAFKRDSVTAPSCKAGPNEFRKSDL